MPRKLKSQPLISVVTPVYNGERYLDEAIRSVREQTFGAWEYVIVDGGSSDRSREIALAHAACDPRITVISEPDQGMYDAVLKGLGRGSAPFCCWINADDRFLPWAFDMVAKYTQISGARWLTGLPATMDKDGLVHTIDAVKWHPRWLIRAGLFHGKALGFIQQEGTFFARSLLARIEPTALARIRGCRQAGDFLLWTELGRFAPLHIVPSLLGTFRWHEGNQTRERDRYYAEIAAAGFFVTPAALGEILNLAFLPLAFVMHKCRLRRWRDLAPRLSEAGVRPVEAAPGSVAAAVTRSGSRPAAP